MSVARLVFQYLLAIAVEGMPLVFLEVIRCHVLTSLLVGRQSLYSPFTPYWSGGDAFWLISAGICKIIFSLAYVVLLSFRSGC